MCERYRARRQWISSQERQMLCAAYLPIIAFVAVLIATRITRVKCAVG